MIAGLAIGSPMGYNIDMLEKNCERCETVFYANQARILKGEAKYCSRTCANKSNARRGKESWNYKGSVTYGAIHDWLNDNFPKPKQCMHCGTLGEKKGRAWNIQWALRNGFKYERNTENFIWLCVKCHIEYDQTSIALQPTWNKGRSWTSEERKRISEGTKLGMAKLK